MDFFKKVKQNIKARLSSVTKKPQFFSILFQINALERTNKKDSQFTITEPVRILYHGIHISLEEAYNGFQKQIREKEKLPEELQSASWGIILWHCSSIEDLLKNSPWVTFGDEKARDLVIVEDDGSARVKAIEPDSEMDQFMEKIKNESETEIKSVKVEDINEIPDVIKSIIEKELKKKDKKEKKLGEILEIPIEIDSSSKKEKEDKELIQSILKKKDKKLLEDNKEKFSKNDYEYLKKRINEKS